MDHYTSPPFQPQAALQEFFDTFKVPHFADDIDEDTRSRHYLLGMDLITEEYQEVYGAFKEGSLPDLAKELADLVYVCFWMAEYFGIDLEKVVRLVHGSNMSKVAPDGTIERDPSGKVLKGQHYKAPDLSAENLFQRPANISVYMLQLPLF